MVVTASAVVGTASAVVGLALPANDLIHKVKQAASKATQNKEECAYLEGRMSELHKLLGRFRLEGPEAAEALSSLCDVLKDAHELVDACQKSSAPRKLASSGDYAEWFRKVNGRIDSQLIQILCCGLADTIHRFDQIIPPAPTSMVAADVYKEGGNDHKRFESDATAAAETMPGRKESMPGMDILEIIPRWRKSIAGRITRVTLGIVFLNPFFIIRGIKGI